MPYFALHLKALNTRFPLPIGCHFTAAMAYTTQPGDHFQPLVAAPTPGTEATDVLICRLIWQPLFGTGHQLEPQLWYNSLGLIINDDV